MGTPESDSSTLLQEVGLRGQPGVGRGVGGHGVVYTVS